MAIKTHLKVIGPVLIFLMSCVRDKAVKYDGIVLSRHMVPMPNVSVDIPVGHGEHKSGGGADLNGTTDNEGRFKITGKVCYNCFGSEINVHTADSGFVEHQAITNTSDIKVILQ